jgi:DNA transformation protein and related proteins
MSTQKETVEFILDKLEDRKVFAARAMFGEYALYCNGKVVALICDDTLFVKILPASASLESDCEQGLPFSRAKPHYVVTEDMFSNATRIAEILANVSSALPQRSIPRKNKR